MDIRVPSLLNYATQAACEMWWRLSSGRSGRADRRPQVESRHQPHRRQRSARAQKRKSPFCNRSMLTTKVRTDGVAKVPEKEQTSL
jgi:hypothetical protein